MFFHLKIVIILLITSKIDAFPRSTSSTSALNVRNFSRDRTGSVNSSYDLASRTDDQYGNRESSSSSPSEDGINKSPASSDCVCVPYYQCESGKIVDDGTGIIDPRNKKPMSHQLPLVIS